MNKKFVERLEEFLSSELEGHTFVMDYEWNADTECCEVSITDAYRKDCNIMVTFKYDSEEEDLLVEMSGDEFAVTREYDWTVKYFWMSVASSLLAYV